MMYLLLPMTFLYLEVFNAVSSGLMGPGFSLDGALFMAAAFGFALQIVVCIFPRKIQKAFLFMASEGITVFYLIEHFTDGAYAAFMSPAAIAEGAGGVLSGFGDIVRDIITSNIPLILMAHVPAAVILLWIFLRKKESRVSFSKAILVLLLLSFICGGTAIQLCCNRNEESYTYGYHYDSAVRCFGIANGVFLDGLYGIIGVPPVPGLEWEPEEEEAFPAEYGENSMALDLEELLAKATGENKALLQQIANQTPAKKNAYTGLFKGKNLILICAESFSKELIREDLNPVLYRLASEGVQIEDFYQPAWGGSTSSGEASILMGLIPTDGVKSIQRAIGRDNSYTLANRLKAYGYTLYAMHDGDQLYYNRPNTHKALGFDEYLAAGGGMKITIPLWPRSDLEMMDYSVPLFVDKEPFFTYYMTVSGHCRYNWKGNNMSGKNKDYIQERLPEASETLQAYYACNYELEKGLESLMAQLEEAGILENTVIVITSDHYPYALEKGSTYGNEEDYLAELYGYKADTVQKRDHNGLIIWSSEFAQMEEPVRITEPCYTPDILPTLLNLFGLEYDSRLFVGRDIFSEEKGMAIWPNGSFVTAEGFYNAGSGTFSGNDVDENYVALYKQKAREKINFSRSFLATDFYKFLNLSYSDLWKDAEE